MKLAGSFESADQGVDAENRDRRDCDTAGLTGELALFRLVNPTRSPGNHSLPAEQRGCAGHLKNLLRFIAVHDTKLAAASLCALRRPNKCLNAA